MVKYIIKINQSILTILNEKWEQKKYKQLSDSTSLFDFGP
jgi:hypothetical protein